MTKSLIELKRLENWVWEDCFDSVHGLTMHGSDALHDIESVRRAILQLELPAQKELLQGWKNYHPNYSYEYELKEIIHNLL